MLFEKSIIKKFNAAILQRYDPDGTIFYYSPEDFDLECERLEFRGDRGQPLQGYFYKKAVTKPERLILFEHGMGCGHRAYMREIATIVDEGYEVFTYDHTGTLESGGEHIGGFSQSLSDLDHALRALKASGLTDGRRITVIGHSWGGFSTLNIAAYHPEIESVVALSGYISVYEMLCSVLGPLKGYAKALTRVEAERFGAYAHADARHTLGATPHTRALIIHSVDDKTCPFLHFEMLESVLRGKDNIKLYRVAGKDHNPNFTREAVVYKNEFFRELTALMKKKKLTTDAEKAAFLARWDFAKMTEQDMALWRDIFDFIDNPLILEETLDGFGAVGESGADVD